MQNHLLRELMRHCKRVIITVLMDERENPFSYKHPYQLFALSKHMVTSLIEIAKEEKITLEEPGYKYEKPVRRFQGNDPLSFLERNLFRGRQDSYRRQQEAVYTRRGRQRRRRLPRLGKSAPLSGRKDTVTGTSV